MFIPVTVICLMAVWLLLSVLRQLTNSPSFWRWDVFHLIPRWTFFAPKPMRFDYLLMTRGRTADDATQPWRESPFLRRRIARELFFNPNSRCNHALYVLTLEALKEARAAGGYAADGRFRRALARVAASLPERRDETPHQAVVVQSFGFITDRTPRAVMTLEPISLDR